MKIIIVLIFIAISIFSNTGSLAKEVLTQKDCGEVYRLCNQEKLKNIWSLWDQWSAGSLNFSKKKFDEMNTDALYEILSCREYSNACEQKRNPDTAKYFERRNIYPEINWPKFKPENIVDSFEKFSAIVDSSSSVTDLRSLLVVKNGNLIHERYYNEKNDHRPQHLQSVTKSITSLLVGIAIDKGYISSDMATVGKYFPNYFSKHHSQDKQNITIQQLLTMTTALGFSDHSSYSKYENTKSWDSVSEWRSYWLVDDYISHALSYDLVEAEEHPIVLYNTPSCNLLTGVVKASSGLNAKQFADKYLFEPLGIDNYYWYADSNKNYLGGHALFLRPRALARIGQMILDGGLYKNHGIVSKAWIDKSFQISLPKTYSLENANNLNLDYGYLWWLANHKGTDFAFAWGWGGQFLILVPSKNALIVTTAYPDADSYNHMRTSQQIIREIALPLIELL